LSEEANVMALPAGVRVTHRVVDSGVKAPLGVACVDPFPDPRRVFVVAMGYGACLDPFELQRFGVLACALEARLIVVETPGCSYLPSRLLGGERRALLRADYGPVSARMLAAALSVGQTDRQDRRLGVMGYSLGASVAAAMARVANRGITEPVALESIVLIEPVANRAWRVPQLLAGMRTEDKLIDGYLKTNDDIPGAVAPTGRTRGALLPRRRRIDLLLLSNALRAGRLVEEVLAAAAGHQDVKVVVAHGASSYLSQMHACSLMVRECREAGIAITDVVTPGHHGLWQSLPAVNDLAGDLNIALGCP
jgi:pimeloyl-ACP methyl ester carboxylesterase